MTILIPAGAGLIPATGAAIGTASGVGIAAASSLVKAGGLLSSAGGAIGASIPFGVIAGATMTQSYTGGVLGGLTAAGGAMAILQNPIGWLVLGVDASLPEPSFDCWKPILHDTSIEASTGRLLRDIVQDSKIQDVRLTANYSECILTNLWGEKFSIKGVALPSGGIALHANRII